MTRVSAIFHGTPVESDTCDALKGCTKYPPGGVGADAVAVEQDSATMVSAINTVKNENVPLILIPPFLKWSYCSLSILAYNVHIAV